MSEEKRRQLRQEANAAATNGDMKAALKASIELAQKNADKELPHYERGSPPPEDDGCESPTR